MTDRKSAVFLLTGVAPEEAMAGGSGALAVKTVHRQPAGRYHVLDTFDGSVGARGDLLIGTPERLYLVTGDGRLLEQAGGWRGGFVGDLDKGPVKAALSGLSSLRSLRPVGSGAVQIRRFALIDEEAKTQVRAEAMDLVPAADDTGLSLVALHGLRGYGKAFDRLGDLLREAGAAAGVQALRARLCPDFEPHSAKPAVSLSPADTAFFTACDLITAHIPVARATEAGIIADHDTEYLHDYRVALRKIRSVLSLFKGVFPDGLTAELKAAFSGLMAPTGPLRDLDVYLLEKELYFGMLPETLHPGLTEMYALFEVERAGAHRKLVRHLKSDAYHAEISRLEAMFAGPDRLGRGPMAQQPALDYARRLIWKRYRRVCKIAAAIDAQTEDEEVHELRIQCKKLRYLMEFFASFFPKADIKDLVKALKRLQDNLGLFNDYSVQQESLRTFLETHKSMDRDRYAEIAKSIGALIAILHRRQSEERAKVMESFSRFDSPDVRARFRALFRKEEGDVS